jgi:hypothetical protein
MSGEIALDTSVAIRFLNGDTAIIERVLNVKLPNPQTVNHLPG